MGVEGCIAFINVTCFPSECQPERTLHSVCPSILSDAMWYDLFVE